MDEMTQTISTKPPTLGLHRALVGLEGLQLRVTTAEGTELEFVLLRCDAPKPHHVFLDGDHTTPLDPTLRILLVEVVSIEASDLSYCADAVGDGRDAL